MIRIRSLPLLCLLFFCLREEAAAQLTAGLTASQTGGCSPITVSFSNITTGASKTATYTWNYGNGNQVTTTDSVYSSGATYVTPGSYQVTLTVQDGTTSSSKSLTVTVYSNPTVSFSLSSGAAGCAPLASAFLGTAAPGSGTISGYYWDFGDGTTQTGSMPAVSHTYNFPGTPTVQLTVTNNFGCSASVQEAGLVTIHPAVVPAFSTDSTSVCLLGDAVPFLNSTTGPPALSYLWKFGDGATSAAVAPTHTYASPGIYSVTLLATSSVGCSDSLEKTAYVNVAQGKPAFSIPALVCSGVQAPLKDLSNPAPNNGSEVWFFSDNDAYEYGSTPSHTFGSAGNYSITMSAVFGACPASLTQNVTVNPAPQMSSFLMQPQTTCGAPETWQFTDTSKGDVAWAWSQDYQSAVINANSFATTQSATYNFTQNGNYMIGLTVTNAQGCQTAVGQWANILPPDISIADSGDWMITCNPPSVKFMTQGYDTVIKFNWNFGDGTTSTEPTPYHTYTTPGTYTATLQWVTSNGCSGTATLVNPIQYLQPPTNNFTISPSNPVCGNTPVTVQAVGNGASEYLWDFGDGSGWQLSTDYTNFTHQYEKEGIYTVTLITIGYYSTCRDTVTKIDSITILPSFPNILSATNTCAGSRGLVDFADSIRGATGITWNFGDGSTLNLPVAQDTVPHTYAKSGAYKVMLTTTSGSCTNKDSTTVYVLLKQKPLLSTTQSIVCANGPLNLTITDLDTNYWEASPSGMGINGSNYYGATYQYGDGTFYAAGPWSGGLTENYTTFSGALLYMQPGEDSIRAILNSALFYCADTTNYVPVKISGPVVGFEPVGNICYRDSVIFADTSRPTFGGPIVKYAWTFGDGTTLTTGAGGPVTHLYAAPGTYYPQLAVTDSSGCTTSTSDIGYIAQFGTTPPPVQLNGPLASFYWTPSNILPGTMATFTNSTSGPYTSALWTFASGGTSNNLSQVTHTYPNVTTDTVTLVVYGNTPGYCPSDTAVEVVPVRNVSASFTYTTSYVNGNSCPPVIFNFTSSSFNVTSWNWNFGDGATAQGSPDPSHTYDTPGKYYVTLTASGSGASVTAIDSVIVKGPYATVSANLSQGCAPSTVTMTAVALNAVSYIWDFGDGTVINNLDTFVTHTYTIPGVYKPTLILEDSLGCKASFSPDSAIVADSLSVAFGKTTAHICDSGQVAFTSNIYSISASRLGETLTYHWDFGTGNAGDTADTPNPEFTYNALGSYAIQLTATSAAGCKSRYTDTVKVTPRDPGTITGPSAACAGDTLHFSGTLAFADAVTWTWLFQGGLTMSGSPVALTLSAGNYLVSLVSDLGGCFDTSSVPLVIHPLPVIVITPAVPVVCLGNSVQLTASGGVTYLWSPAAGLNNSDIPSPVVTPVVSTLYQVQVTSDYGCADTDSIRILVAAPFTIAMPMDTFVCTGDSLQLDPKGAYSYQWIAGIASSSPSPWVLPLVSTTYIVAGFDAYGCFSDTASVTVAVEPLPTVQAASVDPLVAGNSTALRATGSSDVVTWSWSPSNGLSCTACQDPVSTPDSSMHYIVTGATAYGCQASDTIRVVLVCLENTIAVPSAFSPNGDGINDIFFPEGKGVRVIRSFRIYGRWGNLVFERANIPLGDVSNGWDGSSQGFPQPVGAYVYFLDVICDTGEPFTLRGTVTLER